MPTPPKPNPDNKPLVDESKIEGDMYSEEPLGWDQAPEDITNPRDKRHPRTDGKGGIGPSEPPRR